MAKKNFRNGVSSSKLQKRYGSRFQVDSRLYRLLWANLAALFVRRKEADLYCLQLLSHLAEKYCGSLGLASSTSETA